MLDKIYQAFELMDKGQLDEALSLLDGLDVAESDEAYYDYLSTYGYIYTAKADYPAALSAYQTYLTKAVAEANQLHQHRAHHQRCMVYRQQGDLVSAMAELDKERAIISQHFAADDLAWAVHLYEVGYVSHLAGEHDKAVSEMTRSLEYALKTDDLIAQACAYRGLGELLADKNNLLKAKSLFEEAQDEQGSQDIDHLLSHLP